MGPTFNTSSTPEETSLLVSSDSENEEKFALLQSYEQLETRRASTANTVSKLQLFWKSLRIVPMFLVHTWAAVAAFVAMQPLLMEVICRDDLGYTNSICQALTYGNKTSKIPYKLEETQLQIRMAFIMFWRSLIQNGLPMILVLFIGSWSDQHGRKIPMILVLIAYVIQNIGLIICNELRSPWTSTWAISLLTSLVPGLFGGDPSFVMAGFNYITDVSTESERTFLNGCAMGCIFAGVAFGYMLGGLLSTTILTLSQIFICTLIIELLVLGYVLFFLTDKKIDSIASVKQMFLSFIDVNLVRETFYEICKPRHGKKRLALFMLMFAHICAQAPWMGELQVMYIFGKFKFNWNAADYGAFTSSRYIVGFLGNWFAVVVLSKALKLSDPCIGIYSCISGLISYTIFVISPTTFWMYTGSAMSFFVSTMQVIPRSIMSKLVPGNEIGSVSSFLAVFDCIIGISAGPAYTYFYAITLDIFISAFLVLSGGLMIPGIFIYIWFLVNKQDVT